jgi:hypothetical protein
MGREAPAQATERGINRTQQPGADPEVARAAAKPKDTASDQWS